MSLHSPTEEDSTAHTLHNVMLSASEASAFQFRNKADSSEEFILSVTKGLRMTFKDRLVGRPHFFKREHESHEGSDLYTLKLRALRDLRGEISFVPGCGYFPLGVLRVLFYKICIHERRARGAIKLPQQILSVQKAHENAGIARRQ